MTKFERIEYLESEIAELTIAITVIRKGGQSYEITTAAGAGTKRVVTMADYNSLVAEREKLQASLAALSTGRSLRLTAGW
jgi:hypothetical protein